MSHWTHFWHAHCSHSDKALPRTGTTQRNIHTPTHTRSAWCYRSGRDSGNIRPPPPEQTELYPFPFFVTFGQQTCVFHIPATQAGLTGKETQLLNFKVWTKLLDLGSNNFFYSHWSTSRLHDCCEDGILGHNSSSLLNLGYQLAGCRNVGNPKPHVYVNSRPLYWFKSGNNKKKQLFLP